MKKFILSLLLIFISTSAFADGFSLETPHTVNLTPIVSVAGRCSAAQATTEGLDTVVTGFSADGNYVLGQVASWFTCGHSGRGSTVHTDYVCTYLQWDLSGNLVSETTPTQGDKSVPCASVPVVLPSKTPPSSTVVGNEFTSAAGYTAETLIAEACGSIACYATYYYPTLVTP